MSKNDAIESKVPGAQQLRGAPSGPSDPEADYVYTPVLSVTKEETSWTKDGVKLQKVVVRGDASDDSATMNKTITVMESSSPNTLRTEIHTEVRVSSTKDFDGNNGHFEDTKSNDNETKDSKKSTKIPKYSLRQTYDKIKKEELLSQEKIIHEPFLGRKVQSAIPRLKDIKQQETSQTDMKTNNEPISLESPKLDDEFDKLYEEIIEKDSFNTNLQTTDDFNELSKVDTKFEEIIHSYEDKQIINDRVKSKIPLLKRKSEHEIEYPSSHRRSSLKKRHSIEDSSSKIAVLKTKDRTAKTDSEQTKVSNISRSYSNEMKSETFSASKLQASESITSVTTVTQINTTTEEQQFSNENFKVETISINDSKDINKCKIPVSINTKKILESKTSNNIENISEQITTGAVKTLTVDTNKESHKEVYSNKNDEFKSDNNEEKTEEVKALSENKVSSKSEYTSKQENISLDQSSHISEDISVAISSSDNTKVTEISKVSTEIQSHFINEIKETVQVATLKYDVSLDLTSKSEINKGEVNSSNSNITEGIAIVTSDSRKEALSTATKTEIKTENEKASKGLAIRNHLSSHITTEISNKNEDITNELKTESQHNIVKGETAPKTETGNKITNKITKESNNLIQNDVKTINTDTAILSNTPANKELAHKTVLEAINVQTLQKEKVDIGIVEENTNIKELHTEKQKTILFEQNNISSNNNLTNNSFDKDLTKYSKAVKNSLSEHIRNSDDLQEEDIVLLKGKVNRIISRLDSREQTVAKTDLDDLPRNVSVATKISNFEKSDVTNTTHESKAQLTDKTNTITKEIKPKIVDEILKTENVFNFNKTEVKTENESYSLHNKVSDSIATLSKDNASECVYDESNKYRSDYYAMYNRVHSSIINRLNSIETKFKTTEVHESNENETSNVVETKFETNNESTIERIESKSNLKETTSKSEPNISFNRINKAEGSNEVFIDKRESEKVDLFKEYRAKKDPDADKRAKSVAELDIGDAVKGRVRQMVFRMNSMERMRMLMRSDTVDRKEKLRKISITDRVAMFEKKNIPIHAEETTHRSPTKSTSSCIQTLSGEEIEEKILELSTARSKYGKRTNMASVELRDGSTMPALAIGTALLDPHLVKHVVSAAIDLGYRAIDAAYIYGNEKQVGEAIRAKIEDGTVTRGELFIISKLWSTYHRRDLVLKACKQSLETMGLDYFDLYLIHNPMSFKEGSNPLPKIANVLQYSEHDYLEAWYGVEDVIRKGLVRKGGVSNFNSAQVERVVDKGKIKPVINQVECHPYLTQQRLEDFCSTRNVKLSCFGVLGSKGTPAELKSGQPPAIDDPLVKVMSAGLGVTPAQLLIAYQLQAGRNVVVKSSSAYHLWDNLQALNVTLDQAQVSALNALNRNKRTFTFKGMGDTHRNYPFKIAY